MSTAVATESFPITRDSEVCGGQPVIAGTRTPVNSIVGYYKMGMSVEEILEGLPHLNAAQVFDCCGSRLFQPPAAHIKFNSRKRLCTNACCSDMGACHNPVLTFETIDL